MFAIDRAAMLAHRSPVIDGSLGPAVDLLALTAIDEESEILYPYWTILAFDPTATLTIAGSAGYYHIANAHDDAEAARQKRLNQLTGR